MNDFLDNPVYFALISGNSLMANGNAQVKYFDADVSPFAGFPERSTKGFEELHSLLPAGRKILYATRKEIYEPPGWRLLRVINGSQFLYLSKTGFSINETRIVPLGLRDVRQMVELARLTKPGPFAERTIEFGNYHGIFDQEKLVAMTGRRLHVYGYTEVSAVCTHPDHLGKGFASALLQHQVDSILHENQIPFLHVRSDNDRAIDLYERLGFVRNGNMNFYFLRRDDA